MKGESSLSRVQLLATPWTTAYQALLSMGSSRQEYWSGVPLPSLIITAGSIKVHTESGSLPSLSTSRPPTLCNALRKVTRRILDVKSTSFAAFAYLNMGIRNTNGRILWKECKRINIFAAP